MWLSSKCRLVLITLQVFLLRFGYVSLDPYYYYTHENSYKSCLFNESYVAAYNPASQVCCSGSVFPTFSNSYRKCCGSSEIDVTSQVCCDGKVYSFKFGYHCCGGKYFSVKEAKCCNSSVTGDESPLTFPAHVVNDTEAMRAMECCGSKLIDSRTHICCIQFTFNKIYRGILGKSIDGERARRMSNEERSFRDYLNLFLRRVQFNFFKKKFNQTGCCEGKIYNKEEKTCPPDNDHQRYGYLIMEFNRDFIRQTRKYLYRPFDMCNGKIYNAKTHVCCTLGQRSKLPGSVHTDGQVSKIVEAKSRRTICCGLQPYDWDKEICCGDKKIHPQNAQTTMECCGLSVYDTTTQRCCESSAAVEDIHKLPETADSCCGKSKLPFDSKTQVCCGNKVLYIRTEKKARRQYFDCCWDENSKREPSIYDTRTETCCGGAKHAKSVECCGSETLDRKTEVCCKGNKVKKLSQRECCGNKTFNSKLELCCNNETGFVLQRKSRGDECCGNVTYDRREQLCCRTDFSLLGPPITERETAVVFKSTDSIRCCHLTAIDSHTHGCCGGKGYDRSKQLCCGHFDERALSFSWMLIDKNSNSSRCCRQDVYDEDTQRCCNGRIVNSRDQSLRCCGSQLHDREKQICCVDRVFDLSQVKNATCCGNMLFDSEKHICCNGIGMCNGVFKKIVDPHSETKCCYNDDAML